jgi:hypothetical protein
MAQNNDEILIRLGLDASSMTRATQVVVDSQKRAANEYVSFWKKSIDEVERAEIAADVRAATRANRASALWKQRAVVQAERKAVQNAEIAAGSGGFAWVEGMAAGGVGAAAGAAASKHGSHGLGGIVRELGVLGREIFSGNWNRAASSATILVSRLGSFAGIAARLAGIIGAIVEAAAIGIYAVKSGRAADQSNALTASLRAQSGTLAEKLGLPAGSSHEQIIQKQKELIAIQDKSLNDQHDKEVKAYELAVEKNRILQEHAAWQKLYNERVEEEYRINREADGLRKSRSGVLRDIAGIDKFVPTIADLAGRDYANNLDKQYGAGGRFDIADGNGPLAQSARDALLYSKQQAWDVTHGNYAQAELDRKKQMASENLLAKAGVDTPAMRERQMRDHLQDISRDMADLARRAGNEGLKIADAK